MARSLGVAMLGGNPVAGRKPHDFYATPEDVTLALLGKVGDRIRGPVAEPACGDGAICRVLAARGIETIPTDLHDRGYGGHGGGHDILDIRELAADEYVTNPPFEIAVGVIETIMPLRPRFMALLLKGTFWHAKTRIDLFRRFPPSGVYPLTWRPDFEDKGRPTLEMMWTVWDADRPGPVEYDMLPRPEGYGKVRRPPRGKPRVKLEVVAGLDGPVPIPAQPPFPAVVPVGTALVA